MICSQVDWQGLQGLQTYDMFASMWLAKMSYVCKPCKIIPFLFAGISPLNHAQIGIHMIWFGWSSGGFVRSAATLPLKNKHYFILLVIFLSPNDVYLTAIAAPAAKRWTYPSACCRPQLHASLSSRFMMIHCLWCHNPSSLTTAISSPAAAPFCRHCQPLSSHSCHHSLPLLAFTAPINGWLLFLSMLCCLPRPSSTLWSSAAMLLSFWSALYSFSLPPFLLQQWSSLPPLLSTFSPCCAPLIFWCGHLWSVLAGCCIASCHTASSCLLTPLSDDLLLPLVICPDRLLPCFLHLSLCHRILSAWASTSFICQILLPPTSLSPIVEVDWCVLFSSSLKVGKDKYPPTSYPRRAATCTMQFIHLRSTIASSKSVKAWLLTLLLHGHNEGPGVDDPSFFHCCCSMLLFLSCKWEEGG